MRFSARLGWLYLPGTVLLVLAALWLGAHHADGQCRVDDTNCDLGPFVGVLWAGAVLPLWALTLVAGELMVRVLSRRSSSASGG